MAEPQHAPSFVRWDVVEEHFDEAEFLHVLWRDALDTPVFRLDDVVNTVERRMLLHVEGLAIGGAPVAERLLWPALDPAADSLGHATIAGLALLRDAEPHDVDRILAHLLTLPPGPAFDGLAQALCLVPRADAVGRTMTRIERGPENERGPLLVAIASRIGTPGANALAWLEQAARSEDPAHRLAVARIAMHSPRAVGLRAAERLANDPDPTVRIAAIEAALVHGSPGAHQLVIDVARGRIAADPAVVRASFLAIGLTGEPQHVDLARQRLEDPAVRADVVWMLGFGGRPASVDLLLPLLTDKDLGPLAAEAIVGITGIGREDPQFWETGVAQPEVTDEDVTGELPPEPAAPPIPSAEDELPVPIPEPFVRAWSTMRGQMDPRQRFGEGRPLVHASTYAALLAGITMRRRHAVALEVAIRTRGLVCIPTRVLSATARPQLTSLGAAGAIDGNRPFARIS